jgi:hypothetical protein
MSNTEGTIMQLCNKHQTSEPVRCLWGFSHEEQFNHLKAFGRIVDKIKNNSHYEVWP